MIERLADYLFRAERMSQPRAQAMAERMVEALGLEPPRDVRMTCECRCGCHPGNLCATAVDLDARDCEAECRGESGHGIPCEPFIERVLID